MNEASPEKPRRRALGRVAAATATVVSAALLTTSGTAQAAVDCAALGDNPRAGGIAGAFDAAVTCGVEVRISQRSWPYSTVYATPEGQLHLVATADASQEYVNQGHFDPTLSVYGGYLSQERSYWRFLMPYEEDAPLLSTPKVAVDWAGEIPVPSYSGTTAVFDELAPGLDFTVDVDVASAGLKFSATDAAAWEALAANLTANLHNESSMTSLVASDGLLFISDHSTEPLRFPEWTTAFTVRDAAGRVTPVDLTRGDGGALALGLPDGYLESAAYPLELSTQWANRNYSIGEWSATTSAAPELSAYRGEAGLDEPYFQAAGETGTAVVGAYCDGLADLECTEQHQSGAYWSFGWPQIEAGGLQPLASLDYTYPVASASFRVDAADATACVAPDVQLVSGYSPGASWADPPTPVDRPADAGTCQDGTAVYDVTESVQYADDAYASSVPLSFGMTDSADTARFDGDSGRLDVYFDIAGFRYIGPSYTICGYDSSTAPSFADSTPQYGGFLVNTWKPEVLDLDLTWTATFIDVATGETVLTTSPREVVVGSSPRYTLDGANALEDGQYKVVYDFDSAATDLTHTSDPCYFSVDTENPEFISITGGEGPRYVGEKATIEITVADAGFPDGIGELTVDCDYSDTCGWNWPRTIKADTSLSFDVTLAEGDNTLNLKLSDRAGNDDFIQLNLRASYDRNDFDRDGFQDLVAVRESDGRLLFYPGKGDGTFDSPVSLGTGWNKMDVVMAGDLTEDGNPDILARDTATGTMYTYPGKGDGTFGSRIKVGSGWNAMGLFTSGDDYSSVGPGSGSPDLLAVRKSDGKLFYYPGLGNGTFGTPTAISSGWNAMDSLTSVGDLGLDYHNQLLARDSRTGTYYVYTDYGDLTFEDRTAILKTSNGIPITDRIYTEVTAAGDQDGDGFIDLVAIDSRTGELVLNPLTGVRSSAADEAAIGAGWGAIHLPTSDSDRTYDYSGDGRSDVLVRRGSDGKLYFYSGNGSTGFGPISSWGTDLKNLNLIETAGDLNGDGFSDLIGRVASTGSLYLFPGKGNGTYDYAARVRIGTGWNSMSAIVSGHDYNGDGKVDVIAREKSTGYLWLYAGKGDGTIGSRVQIGTGWNSLRDITAVGDLDHDGHADLIAIRGSDNCMYFYGGRGNGTLKAGVKMSCNWVGYDSVTAVGDFNGDGHADWLARRQSDGALYLYKGNGVGGYSARAQIASGWTWANAIA